MFAPTSADFHARSGQFGGELGERPPGSPGRTPLPPYAGHGRARDAGVREGGAAPEPDAYSFASSFGRSAMAVQPAPNSTSPPAMARSQLGRRYQGCSSPACAASTTATVTTA